jgi:hypothetical protein
MLFLQTLRQIDGRHLAVCTPPFEILLYLTPEFDRDHFFFLGSSCRRVALQNASFIGGNKGP